MAQYLRFILLLPHRDGGKVLGAYSRRLFAGGFWGAYSFPAALPLGIVSRPFTRGELKTLAAALRELTISQGGDGKIRTGTPALAFPVRGPAAGKAELPGFTFFGPSLNLTLPPELLPPELLRFRFSSPVLCAALLSGDGPEKPPPPAPAFSFRAAAVANMILRPLPGGDEPGNFEGLSFEWKTGERVWLPAYKKPEKG
ncbi:MAG: hypothetical protein LBP43_02065 [Treponema sp.]|jgi:hypothetical protein|nr:hypothetical protein [Treponema sp.]